MAEEISPKTTINVMGQYRPEGVPATAEGRAEYPEIARRPTGKEIAEARAEAQRLGLRLAR